MAYTFNTGNPVVPNGSADPRDLVDNSQVADRLITSTELTVPDRLGVARKTFAGMGAEFNAFLAASGFETPVLVYTDGVPLQVDRPTQLLERASDPGTLYSIKLPSAFPVILTGTWATDEALLVVRADQALRQELSIISVREFTGPPDGVTSNQAGIETAVAVALAAGAELLWPAGTYVSDANIPHFHDVTHSGKGVIKRGNTVFPVAPRGTYSAPIYLHVDPVTGDDVNDGLTSNLAFKTLSRVSTVIDRMGPVLVGNWIVELAAGTYNDGIYLRGIRTGKNYLTFRGPDVGYGVPSAVIDITGASTSTGVNLGRDMSVEIRDILVRGASQYGFLIDTRSTAYMVNPHVDGAGRACIYISKARLLLQGGNLDGGGTAREGVSFYQGSNGFIGYNSQRVAISNCEYGVDVIGSSYSHTDFVDFSNCTTGLASRFQSHSTNYDNTFTNCTTGWEWADGSTINSLRTTLTNVNTRSRGRNSMGGSDDGSPGTGTSYRWEKTQQVYPNKGTLGRSSFGYEGWEVPWATFQYSYNGKSSGAITSGHSIATAMWESDGNTVIGVACPTGSYGSLWFSSPKNSRAGEIRYRDSDDELSAYFGGSLALQLRKNSRLAPGADAVYGLGASNLRWTQVYSSTGTINTSDDRAKQQTRPIDDAALRAWARVEYVQYKFNDAVEKKGDGARWHFGLIAQRVKEAFEAEGLNAFDYGLLCYDEWEEVPEVSEQVDEDGAVAVEAVPYQPAGNRYGIRYEEALALECAYLRSRLG